MLVTREGRKWILRRLPNRRRQSCSGNADRYCLPPRFNNLQEIESAEIPPRDLDCPSWPSVYHRLVHVSTKIMSSDGIDDTHTNLALPKTDATLTIRVIKSFEYRTERSLVLHRINLEENTVGELKEKVRQGNCRLPYEHEPFSKA